MPSGDKPYRVYRGGGIRARLPGAAKLPSLPKKGKAERKPGAPSVKRKRRWWRWVAAGVGVFLVFVIAWSLASYFQFRDGVSAANKRVDQKTRAALNDQDGLLLGKASIILLLGTDHAKFAGREEAHRTDSITLVRTDPDHHRIAFLSIPRDLRVHIPGYADQKINAAAQLGGPALAIHTVRELTGLPINHIVVVDFAQFEDLIDKLGGVDINVPAPIISKFDCPYPTNTRCARWKGWRFHKGNQHMNGKRALIYSRVRKNELDPSETDFERAERNQQVLDAIAGKLTSFWTFVKLPFIGDDLLAPIATDLGAGQLLSLGWVKSRAGPTLRCRLGGEPSGGELIAHDENRLVLSMFAGESAAVELFPAPFAPGCVKGNKPFKKR
jgi:LCP family protein required for cell wall assembly